MKIIGGPFPLYRNSQDDMEARGMHEKLHMDNTGVTNNSLNMMHTAETYPSYHIRSKDYH